jgi:hypothetical protein
VGGERAGVQRALRLLADPGRRNGILLPHHCRTPPRRSQGRSTCPPETADLDAPRKLVSWRRRHAAGRRLRVMENFMFTLRT